MNWGFAATAMGLKGSPKGSRMSRSIAVQGVSGLTRPLNGHAGGTFWGITKPVAGGPGGSRVRTKPGPASVAPEGLMGAEILRLKLSRCRGRRWQEAKPG